MTPDRPLLGVMLMLGFCIVAPLGDAVAKILSAALPLGVILLTRFAAQAILLVPITLVSGGRLWASRRLMWLIAARTVLHIMGIGAMFAAFRFLPLADAIAIAFVMPFIMLFLGKYFLGEAVGRRRIWASLVGFIGTLMVVQPSFAAVGAPALLPLFVAVNFAFFMLVTRAMAKDIDAVSMQAISGLMATPVLAIAILLFSSAWVEARLVWPTEDQWPLLIFIGVLGTLGHLLMTWSLRFAPAATLAPMQYLEIPFATLMGWLIFGDLPNGLAAVGIAVTIGAGLYIVWRERLTEREAHGL